MDTTPEDIADPESDFEENSKKSANMTKEQVTGVDEPPAPPYRVTDTDDVGPLPERRREENPQSFTSTVVAVGVVHNAFGITTPTVNWITESFKRLHQNTAQRNMPRWMTLPANWQDADREAIIHELEQQGIIWESTGRRSR